MSGVLLTLAAGAAADDLNTEFTAFGGYRFGGTFDVRDSDSEYAWQDSSSYGLIWNHDYRDNTEWEVFFSRQESEAEFSDVTIVDPAVDVETTIVQLGGTYLWDGETVLPYLAATIGGTHIRVKSVRTESDTFLSGSIGVGIKMAPTSRIGLRLEARGHWALTSNGTKLFCSTGPDLSVCAIEVDGSLFSQVELFTGVVVRF